MNPSLFLKTPPPLSSAWLAHEKAAHLLVPKLPASNPAKDYSSRAKILNAQLLAGRDAHLASGLSITDFLLAASSHSHQIPVRRYIPFAQEDEPGKEISETGPMVIYYHGGGLCVGDLETEDLTCRRISLLLSCTVYSVDYRLMPLHTADDALADAESAFVQLTANKSPSRLIIAGSSSGGQLAAQVSQMHLRNPSTEQVKVDGILLRGPVTCNASDSGSNLPSKWKAHHTSMSPLFYTSLVSETALDITNRTTAPLPLEVENLGTLPKHWMQVCTNDIYYSDGVCYAAQLIEDGVDVRVDVEEGMPHTYWLKAPFMEEAVGAEEKMIEGMRWLLEG